MGKAKDSETLSVYVRKNIVAEILARGEALDKKKGTYAALILEKWYADGCPPVTESDRLMQISKQGKPAKKAS